MGKATWAPDGGAIQNWRQAAKAWRDSVLIVRSEQGATIRFKEPVPTISEVERKRYAKELDRAQRAVAAGKEPKWPKAFGPFPLPSCHEAALALRDATKALAELAREHKQPALLASKLMRRAEEWSTYPTWELHEAVREAEVLADDLEALLGMKKEQQDSAVVLGNPLTLPILEALKKAGGKAQVGPLIENCEHYLDGDDDGDEAKAREALRKRIGRHVDNVLKPRDLVTRQGRQGRLFVLLPDGEKMLAENSKRLRDRFK